MRLRFFKLTGMKDFFDYRNDPPQNSRLPESIPAGNPDFSFRLLRLLCGNTKSHRHDRFKFKYVSYIINERLRFAGMNKTNGRRISRRQNGRFGNAIQTGCGRT
jgi:hypothetical protein